MKPHLESNSSIVKKNLNLKDYMEMIEPPPKKKFVGLDEVLMKEK